MTTKELAEVKSLLNYDPECGDLTWTTSRGSISAGSICRSVNEEGYRTVFILGKSYRVHRVAFLLMNGRWPLGEVDHINGDKKDNRWSNLRESTHSQNLCNSKLSKANKSGIKGVQFHSRNKRWTANIRINNKQVSLGYFNSKEDATKCINQKRIQLHGEYARFN